VLVSDILIFVSSDITSDMVSRWLSRIMTSVPVGFSRYYILGLLSKNHTLSAEEIIDKAIIDSQGKRRPSLELVHSLLIRLHQEGLIDDEAKDGKYKITTKGSAIVKDIQLTSNILPKTITFVLKMGNKAKTMTTTIIMDLIDRMSFGINSMLSSNLGKIIYKEKKETEIQKGKEIEL
jgi:DNA-binding PadR family transcriptional regulator